MAQTNFTPISLYFSTTAAAVPTAGNLVNGELAINITDGRLYYKDNAGVVKVIAGAGGAGIAGGSNTQVQFNSSGSLAGSANMTFNGTTLTVNDLTDSSLTANRVVYAGTGGNLVNSANFTFNGTTVTMANDASISGLTVGKGGGAVVGNSAIGFGALANNTGSQNTAVGYNAMTTNTSGIQNAAVGQGALNNNTTGGQNAALGYVALFSNTSGSQNAAFGSQALTSNTTGTNNSSFGYQSLISNTTASNNTAVGYQAGYSNTTGTQSTYVGMFAGYSTTSNNNTFVGYGAGYNVSTGTKNTILGSYNGNQGGLDIRTASNYIVLSDGDGNPRGYSDGSGNWTFTGSLKPSQTAGIVGTTTNNNANTGAVGEYIESTATNYTVTTTVSNPTSISLTAGDWDVTVITSGGGASATATASRLGINTTATTMGSQATDFILIVNDVVNGPSAGMFTKRISLSATTTVYASQKTDAGTTAFQNCVLSARRVR